MLSDQVEAESRVADVGQWEDLVQAMDTDAVAFRMAHPRVDELNAGLHRWLLVLSKHSQSLID